MIPLKDDNPTSRTPWVTMGLIALNLAIFVYQLTLTPREAAYFIHQYGLVPRILTSLDWGQLPPHWLPPPLTLFTSQFLHGGILHVLGNMLYLWIFGNNIEDSLGPVRFVLFYLAAGLAAALAQLVTDPASPAPVIGASGAIAGVLGAYLMLFPRANVLVLFWFLVFFRLIKIPAVILLGIWFAWQIVGLGGRGIAWMAHIGGFVAGLLTIHQFLPKSRPGVGPQQDR